MVVQEKLYTVQEFWEEFGETKHLELVRGVPIEMSPTGETHMIIAAWLTHLLFTYVEAHDLGIITASEGGFTLSTNPAIVRAPDVGFIAKVRLSKPSTERYFSGPPDFAVEVVSPNDKATEIHEKVMDFLKAGTRLVWVVYPGSRTVVVHQQNTASYTFTAENTLDGGDVLPGFTLPVREIFKKLRDESSI
jgi:Uma2 family endonuclease